MLIIYKICIKTLKTKGSQHSSGNKEKKLVLKEMIIDENVSPLFLNKVLAILCLNNDENIITPTICNSFYLIAFHCQFKINS